MKLIVNGQEMEFQAGASALDVLEKLPKEVKKSALVAKINGELISLMEPIAQEGELEFLTFDDPDGPLDAAPHRQPRPGAGGQGAQARGQAGHRPGDRQRLLLRL